MQLINQISEVIPNNIYFEVALFKYQEKILYLEADSDSSDSVGKIVDKLKSIKTLTDVVKKSETPKAGSDGKLIHFVVTAHIL